MQMQPKCPTALLQSQSAENVQRKHVKGRLKRHPHLPGQEDDLARHVHAWR